MHVAQRRGVHVDVDQARAAQRMPERQPGLLGRLPPGRGPRRLARLQVTARLQPDAHALVPVQHDATRADDERGPGHVRGAPEARERRRQAGQRVQQPEAGAPLAQVDRSRQPDHLRADFLANGLLECHPAAVP
jgi:hypothetical protein